ncbi:hypothetical protein [Nocardia sp. MW-W600-9]
MTTFAMYGAIGVACVIVAAVVVTFTFALVAHAITSSHPVLTPECEEDPAAGDAAGSTNFPPR